MVNVQQKEEELAQALQALLPRGVRVRSFQEPQQDVSTFSATIEFTAAIPIPTDVILDDPPVKDIALLLKPELRKLIETWLLETA